MTEHKPKLTKAQREALEILNDVRKAIVSNKTKRFSRIGPLIHTKTAEQLNSLGWATIGELSIWITPAGREALGHD